MTDASSSSPSPFSRDQQTLTVREFELFREAQGKLEHERELRASLALAALERKMEAAFAASEKALALANSETKVHLAALNGEQSRLASDRERFISRESYEVAQKEFGMWRDQINAALHIGAGRDRGIGLSWGVIIGLIGTATAVGSIILALVRRGP